MELILVEDVPNLGSLGDTVQVKSGYGRNFLIPKGMAILAKGKESKEMRHRIEYIEKLREGKIKLAKEQATRLETLNLEVVRKAGSEGKLFGSVSNRDLNELLKDNNFEFERKSIILNSPIRSVGTHEFTVRIHSEVTQLLKIKVIGDTEKIKLVEKSNNSIKDLKNVETVNLNEKNENIDEQYIKLEETSEEKQDLKEKNKVKKKKDLKEDKAPEENLNLKEDKVLEEKPGFKEKKESKKKQDPNKKLQPITEQDSIGDKKIKEKQKHEESKKPKE